MYRRALAFLLLVSIAQAGGTSAPWPTYVNETLTRMPTGSGLNDPAFTTADPDDKNYAWGDVDNDGDTDLVCVRKKAYLIGRRRNVLYLNEGIAQGHAINGVLIDRTATFASDATDGGQGMLDLTDDRDVALIDVDGDGWLDIVTSTTYGQGLPKTISHPRVYMNKGEMAGAWQGFRYEEIRTPTMPITPNFCAVGSGDVTGDGLPDLYHIEYNNNLEDRLWINDGTGHFVDESQSRMTAQMLESEFGTHAEIADMNGDGANDVIKVRSNGSPYRVTISYNNPDNEGFFDTFSVVYSGSPYYVEIADLNNDSLLDIVIQDDATDRYFLNQGNGPSGLAEFIGYAFPPQSSGFEGTIEVADLNNDDFIDVIITDEAVNDVGVPCARFMHIWKNRADVPNITFEEDTTSLPTAARNAVSDVAPFDINGDGWRDLVIGSCNGTSVWISQPPLGVNFSFPNALPTTVPTQVATEIQVDLQPFGDTLDPTGLLLHTAAGNAAFQSTPLTPVAGNLYGGLLGPNDCLDRVSFYFSAQLAGGATVVDPPGAPETTYRVSVADTIDIALLDNIEADITDWTITSDPTLTSGQWEQAEPNGTLQGAELAAPPQDATEGAANVLAFVTENGAPGGAAGTNDIDGGATYLVSPPLDLDGADARISYARWFFSALATPDALVVEVSNNGGDTWITVEQVASTNGSWQQTSFVVGDFVQPTSDVRVRFTASDFDASISEAGIDDFQVEVFSCALTTDPIPTVSQWGLAVLVLLTLAAGTIVFNKRSWPALAAENQSKG